MKSIKKNPTSEQLMTVINNFKSVLPLAKKRRWHLNMGEGHVNCHQHKCGTIHCHGGWYTVATCNLQKALTYNNGADKMAKDLGKKNMLHLGDWAKANPKIWGNESGVHMFSGDNFAFYHPKKRRRGATNLQHIIDHWTEVYERVLEIELEKKKKKLLSVPPVNDLINSALSATPIKKSNVRLKVS